MKRIWLELGNQAIQSRLTEEYLSVSENGKRKREIGKGRTVCP